MTYGEARGRARACRAKRDGEGDRLWSEVAVRVAERTGREAGVKAADQYERKQGAHIYVPTSRSKRSGPSSRAPCRGSGCERRISGERGSVVIR